ncbi:MAG: DUF932 domain-containing protein [Novosphingobium sp.]|nr:DUF932 domain-containing protein [Novosphingobium sp.]
METFNITFLRNRQIDKSILTFPVHIEPLTFVSPSAKTLYDGDCGLAVVREDTNVIIDTVKTDYSLLLHKDLIDAVESAFKINKLDFEVFDIFTGGTKGNKMFLNYAFPDNTIKIADEDYFPFMQLQNSYNKSLNARIVAGLYRKICTNGLVRYHSKNTILNVKHLGKKIDLSSISLKVNDWWEEINLTKFKLEEIVNVSIPEQFEEIEKITDRVFETKKDKEMFLQSDLIKRYFDELGSNHYALLNAYTHYITHHLATRMNDFDRVAKSYSVLENIFLN